MEIILIEYKNFLQEILDRYSSLLDNIYVEPSRGWLNSAPVEKLSIRIKLLGEFMKEFNDTGTSKANELLSVHSKEFEAGDLKAELQLIGKKFLNEFTQEHFKGIINPV